MIQIERNIVQAEGQVIGEFTGTTKRKEQS